MADNPIFATIWHCFRNIPKITRKTKKISSLFFFISSFFLSLLLSFSWVSAKEVPKPQLQDWQFEGIVAALDDQYPEVRQKAVEKLTEYDLQNLQSQQRQEFAKKAVDILKDEKVPYYVRSLVAEALGKLGDAARPYVPDIIAILKDEKVSYFVRYSAAEALGKLGNVAQPYVPDIIAILKDEKVPDSFRYSAAEALGKLGNVAQPYVPDIIAILKDEKVPDSFRSSTAEALGSLGDAAKPYVQDIANLLKDEKVNPSVRFRAARALGNLGDLAGHYILDIIALLKDKNVEYVVRLVVQTGTPIDILVNLGDAARPYVQDIANLLKDKNVDPPVRAVAAEALGKLGDAAKPYVKDIANLLKDENLDPSVRFRAAEALGKLGDAAKPYVKDIANLLKDEKVFDYARFKAAEALGSLGNAAEPYVPDILAFLKDEKVDRFFRSSTAEALGKLGNAAQPYVKGIANLLKDEKVNPSVRSSAAEALGKLGNVAKPYVPDIIAILKDEKVPHSVRYNAAEALGKLGNVAQPYVPDIIAILKDEKVNTYVRYSAAEALGKLGNVAQPYVPDIIAILKDEKVNANIPTSNNIRSSAAEALVKLGDAAKPYIPDIANLLQDKNVEAYVRYSAAEALGNCGDAAQPYVPDILAFLTDEKVPDSVRSDAAGALGKIEKLSLDQVVLVLNNFYYPAEQTQLDKLDDWRFLTYFLSGGSDDVKTLLKWFGHRDEKTVEEQLKLLKYDQGKKALEVFAKTWEPTQGLRLRKELVDKIVLVAKKVSWQPQDIALLQTHYQNLNKDKYNEADTVRSVINNLKGWNLLFKAKNTILIHILFWLLLIFAYPKFPQVQAILFWNPWVRRILGMGYVGFLLTWVPFLRRKLFEPFQPSLLADAGLDNFHPQAYFSESGVVETQSFSLETRNSPSVQGIIPPITQAIPTIKGQIILEGDSGLGKSMFLRHLVKNSSHIVVYLPAHKCEKGVIEAIQAKLHGQAQDADFLKNLIYSGAIDICIDGINEVTADTRAKICQFVESYFRGNIIMTTQPLEWIPPSTAKTYYLQPLTKRQIEKFLVSRISRLPQDAPVQGTEYEKACQQYLADTLNSQQPPEELAAIQRILSNPMDLSLVALMISQGKQPDLFRLQEQQYKQMAAEYLQEWGHEFPLKKFSQAVYDMRLNDKSALPAEEFPQEVLSMEDEKYKMVISRQWEDSNSEASIPINMKLGDIKMEKKERKQWYFRHDKIMEFFLVQNFLGTSQEVEKRLIDHMGDPRFRGVYFLLATLLPLDEAKALREQLIQYAADTKDHTVSDTFVQLLLTR